MALADTADPLHEKARRARDDSLREGRVLVSTDYVVDETLTLFRIRLGLDAAERWWDQVSGSARLRWKWIDPDRAEKARAWFFRWRDKRFSFTDCTSFVVMKELRIQEALTADRDFEKAGFRILP